MGETTNLGSQTLCDRLYDFIKRFICPESSYEKLTVEHSSYTAAETIESNINSGTNAYVQSNNNGCYAGVNDDESDEFLVLSWLAQRPISDSHIQCYKPCFSAQIRMRLFPETLSAWSLALKRRRLERHCRQTPFVRYEMQFITNALKDVHNRQLEEGFLSVEHEGIVDDVTGDDFANGDINSNSNISNGNINMNSNNNSNIDDNDCCCIITRPSSPCRSSSTLSSGYSSEELSSTSSTSSNSSLSQYSCIYAPEIATKDDVLITTAAETTVALPKSLSDMQTPIFSRNHLSENAENGTAPYDTDSVKSRQQVPTENTDDTSTSPVKILPNLTSSSARRTVTYVDDVRLRTHIERAFKYCKLFEILEQPANRFRISPTSCGLGLPLVHLDLCWPPVNAVRNIAYNGLKCTKRRTASIYGKKQRRERLAVTPSRKTRLEGAVKFERGDMSDIDDVISGFRSDLFCMETISKSNGDQISATLGLDAMTLQYVSSSSSLSSCNNLFEQDSKLYVSEMDVLSEEIWDYHISTTQSEEILNLKMQLRDVLYCALSQLFPMCGLYIVGSSLNGFGTNSSDMDLCLMISCKEINQRTDAVVVLDLVRSLFNNMNFIREQKLIIAKVPILRIHFYDPYASIVVDLNANNSVAIRNTQLLCYYSYYDWRVRPLVSVVKEWAKRRDINDASRSSFTSYSLVLMVIHYLQCEAKLLPSLQEKYPKVFNQRVDVRTLSVSVPLEPQGFCQKTFDSHDVPTLGELLLGFFEYFAKKFDYENDAISIRLGKKTERRYVANHLFPCNGRISQWNCICIEEPFNYSNTAHSVHDQYVFEQIRLAFAEDYEKLEQTRDLHAFLDVNPLSSRPESFQRYSATGSALTNSSETTANDDSKEFYCQDICGDASVHESKNCCDGDGCVIDFGCDWRHLTKSELVSNTTL